MGELEARLEDAVYVDEEGLPDHIVAMNSTVELMDTASRKCQLATLVYPDETEFVDKPVSILEALGIALLGSASGSVIQCGKGRSMKRFRVRRISHQSE
jgi:regulator of nucleoside diphosphate kinase